MDIKELFINFANVWKSKARKQYIESAVITDPHSPPLWRINGSLPNVMEFYQVFDIKPTNKMYIEPDKRANIWGSA